MKGSNFKPHTCSIAPKKKKKIVIIIFHHLNTPPPINHFKVETFVISKYMFVNLIFLKEMDQYK